MNDIEITYAARQICSEHVVKEKNDDWTHYLSGRYDQTVWMRLVEQGIRKGIRKGIERREAFKQEVSDAVETYFQQPDYLGKFNDTLGRFIIPKPKPDPLLDVLADTFGASLIDANELRAALEARGLEIREKGQ